jgi:hypothetical protein
VLLVVRGQVPLLQLLLSPAAMACSGMCVTAQPLAECP